MAEKDRTTAEGSLREIRTDLAQAKRKTPAATPALEAVEATASRAIFTAQEARRIFYEEYARLQQKKDNE
jgi:hypothetical protein